MLFQRNHTIFALGLLFCAPQIFAMDDQPVSTATLFKGFDVVTPEEVKAILEEHTRALALAVALGAKEAVEVAPALPFEGAIETLKQTEIFRHNEWFKYKIQVSWNKIYANQDQQSEIAGLICKAYGTTTDKIDEALTRATDDIKRLWERHKDLFSKTVEIEKEKLKNERIAYMTEFKDAYARINWLLTFDIKKELSGLPPFNIVSTYKPGRQSRATSPTAPRTL